MASNLGTVYVELSLDDKVYKQKLSETLTTTQATARGIETSWKALGSKSEAVYNAQRKAAENAYTLIKSHASSTANDIVRAEEAKNAKLKTLNDQQFGHQTSLLESLKKNWIAATALATAAFYAATRIYSLGKSAASALNDIDRLSRVAGMSSDQFQKMTYAAKMMDVEAGDLAVGIKKLSVNMDEASRGVGDAAKRFASMGLSVKDTSGKLKPLDIMMGEIANKFSQWEDGPRKIAIAVDIFGRSGERLIPFLNKGSAGLREFYEEAAKAGIIIGKDLVDAGSKMEDQFKRIEARVDSLTKKLVVTVWENFFNIEKQMERMKKEYGERIFIPEIGPPETRFKLPVPPKVVAPEMADVKKLAEELDKAIKKAAEYGKAMSDIEQVTLGFDLALSSTGITLDQYKEKMKFVKDEEEFWNEMTKEAIKISGELGSYDFSTSVYGTSLEGISGIWKTNLDESKKYWDEQISEALKASEGLRSYDEALSVLGTNTAGYWKIQGEIFKKETSQWQAITESLAQDLSSAWASNMTNIIRSTESTSEKIKSFFQSIGDVFLSTVSKMITQWLIFGSLTGEKGGWGSKDKTSWGGILGSVISIFGKEGGIYPSWTPVKAYQYGGIADRPTLGVFGEGGPEAVIPLKGGKVPVEMKGGGKGDTYITYIQATDVDSFARLYGPAIESIQYQGRRYNRMSQRR